MSHDKKMTRPSPQFHSVRNPDLANDHFPDLTGMTRAEILKIALSILQHNPSSVENLLYVLQKEQEDNKSLRLENETLVTEVATDHMTELNNRRYFENLLDRLSMEMNQTYKGDKRKSKDSEKRDKAQNYTIIVLDIDGFKNVNDELGHPMGDQILKCFSKDILRASLRETDFCARIGGEEFAIVLVNADEESILKVLKKIEENRKKTWIAVGNGLEINIGVSHGFYTATPSDTPQTTFEQADKELYAMKAAKGEGRKILNIRPQHALLENDSLS